MQWWGLTRTHVITHPGWYLVSRLGVIKTSAALGGDRDMGQGMEEGGPVTTQTGDKTWHKTWGNMGQILLCYLIFLQNTHWTSFSTKEERQYCSITCINASCRPELLLYLYYIYIWLSEQYWLGSLPGLCPKTVCVKEIKISRQYPCFIAHCGAIVTRPPNQLKTE